MPADLTGAMYVEEAHKETEITLKSASARIHAQRPFRRSQCISRQQRRQARRVGIRRWKGLVSAFSILALVLAGVGIFGVTAYAVTQRTREFGIRLALGAQPRPIRGLVLRRVGLVALLGTGIGAALGNGLGSLMSGLLFEVTPDDPATFSAALIVIGLTALAATIVPLSRAVRVSPATTRKAE